MKSPNTKSCRTLLSLALSVACWQAATALDSTKQLPVAPKHGLPVVFEPNRGQAPASTRYIARTADGEVLLMPDGLEIIQFGHNVQSSFKLRFSGSNTPDFHPEFATGGVTNYYRGQDQSSWIAQVPHFRRLRYGHIYPGTDLVFHGSASRLEYDFELAPNADPVRIQVDFDEADKLELESDGSLLVTESARKLRLLVPAASQQDGTDVRTVPVSYRILGTHTVGFAVGPYDRGKELVIDPVVSYATSIAAGGSTQVAAIAADGSGDLIMVGSTYGSNYPVVNGLPSVTNPSEEVVVTKLDPTGKNIVYSTYLPASNFNTASAIAVDSGGNAYVTGITSGYDFPVTSQNLGTCSSFCNAGFITKLNPTGAIVYSTLLASGQILPKAIVVNALGNAYVSGLATDGSLQTVNAFQPSYNGEICTACNSAFFVKLNTAGTAYVFSSYLGANDNATGIALDSSGNLYVAGTFNSYYQSSIPLKNQFQSGLGGFFLNKFSSDGQTLLFGSFFGGDIRGSSNPESLAGVGVGSDGTVYLAGGTTSDGFPYTLNAYRQPGGQANGPTMFALAFNPTLTALKYSTYLGQGYVNAMAVDASGDLYLAAAPGGDSIQAKAAVVADITSGGEFLELDATGNPVQISGFGGHSVLQSPSAIAVDPVGDIYLAGNPGGAPGGFISNCSAYDPIIVGAAAYQSQTTTGSGCGGGSSLFFAKIAPDAKPQISLGYTLPFLPLHNVGSADLHISNIAFSGGITKAQGNCGTTVPAGGSCVLTLTDATGNLAQGSVTITSNASPAVQTFTPYLNPNAIGSPVQDFLWTDISQLVFPPQQSGTSSAARSFQLWNVGVTSLDLQAISAQGSLLQTHNCTTPLAPGAFCTVQVVWKPSATGNNYGNSVSVTYDNGLALVYMIPSEFITTPNPLLISQANPIPFGTQAVGNPSMYRTVTVTNVSNAQVAAPSAALNGDGAFSLAGNTCTASLAPQQSCVIAVLFTPVINGDSSSNLSISGGASASIPLSGTGQIASAVTISPLQLQWLQVVHGAGYSQNVTLMNTSAGTIPISSIAFTLPDFSETDNCAGAVAAGASCTVQVMFQPLEAGTENGTMTVSFGGQALAQVIPLQGQSIYPVSLSPTSVDFGTSNEVGSTSSPQSVSISNHTFNSQSYTLSVTGPFTVQNSCPNPMPSNYGCGAAVSFTPQSAGVSTGTLTLSVPGMAANATVSLRGTASATAPASGLQFVPVTPCRVADTRNPTGPFGGPEPTAGSTTTFDIPQGPCNIPSTAVAYSLNVTVVPDASLNYLTLWPSGQTQPNVSVLNSDGRVKANAAIIPAGNNGGVSVFVTDPTQVILDIDGYFVAAGTASALEFYPVTPCRIADTRQATGPLGGPFISAGGSRAFTVQSSNCGLPATAQAYSLNVTAVPDTTLNYLTIWPTGQPQPNVSTLNSSTGAVTANAAIVPAGSGGDVSVFVYDDADVILDVNGYFAPPTPGGLSLYTVTPCRVIDTRPDQFTGTIMVNVHGSTCAAPSTAEAYVLNATVVPVGALNYLTLWPDGVSQPYVSTLNADDGAVTSNMAIVPTNNGAVDACAKGTTNLILDFSGYFAP